MIEAEEMKEMKTKNRSDGESVGDSGGRDEADEGKV